METQALLKKLVLKAAEKEVQTRLYTLAEKKTIAIIFTLVSRLTKVQVKTIGDTVTSIETYDLLETNHPLIKTKSNRQSPQWYYERRSRRLVTHLLWKDRGTFRRANSKDSVSQE